MTATLELVVTHHPTGAGTLRLFHNGKPSNAECSATAIALPDAIERYQSLYHVADDHVRHVDKDGQPWQEPAQFAVGQPSGWANYDQLRRCMETPGGLQQWSTDAQCDLADVLFDMLVEVNHILFDTDTIGVKHSQYNALRSAVLTLLHNFTPESLAALYALVDPAESNGAR